MTFRRILTASLLLFVAVSLGTLVGKEWNRDPSPPGSPSGIPAEIPADGRQLVAYYFAGTVRCATCRKIEEISRATIESSFPEELAAHRLRFLAVDVDRPENRHFVEDFRLESSSLVLVEIRNGTPSGWKNLSAVWTLAEDGPELERYVREEVASRLKRI